MSSWSCPHDAEGVCQLVRGARCEPGMRGCILHGRYRFLQDELQGGERKPEKATPAEAPAPKPRR